MREIGLCAITVLFSIELFVSGAKVLFPVNDIDAYATCNCAILVGASCMILCGAVVKIDSMLSGDRFWRRWNFPICCVAFGWSLLVMCGARILLFSTTRFETCLLASMSLTSTVGSASLLLIAACCDPTDNDRDRCGYCCGSNERGDRRYKHCRRITVATTSAAATEKIDRANRNNGATETERFHVLFLEGTSGLGKTTLAHRTLDFTDYCQKYPIYSAKETNGYLQILYDWHILIDSVSAMRELTTLVEQVHTQSHVLIDRSFVSQIAYSILFQCNGHFARPDDFARETTKLVFSRTETTDMIRFLVRRWFRTLRDMLGPDIGLGVQWFVAANTEYTAKVVRDRGGEDANMPNLDLENYIINQNYVFEQLYRICGVGHCSSVYHISESDIATKMSKTCANHAYVLPSDGDDRVESDRDSCSI